MHSTSKLIPCPYPCSSVDSMVIHALATEQKSITQLAHTLVLFYCFIPQIFLNDYPPNKQIHISQDPPHN